MAEFCLDCMNKYIGSDGKRLLYSEVDLDIDFCEGCGEWKKCVVGIQRKKKMPDIIKWFIKNRQLL